MRHRTEQIIPGTVGQFVRTTLGGKSTWGPGYFDAIVATSGGDFALPSAAFAAGHKSVFVRDGTYVETANIVIPTGGTMIGESVNAFIDLSGGFSVTIDGSARKETAGTITFTNGSTAVVGVGTTFTNMLAGDYIGIGAVFFEIASITDATNLVLARAWEGRTRSGFPMFAVSMLKDVLMKNLYIFDATGTGLAITSLLNAHFDNVQLVNCLNNLLIVDSGTLVFDTCRSSDSTNDGVDLATSRTVRFDECHFENNAGHGAEVNTSSLAIKFDGCEFDGNGLNGANITGNSTDVIIAGCGSKNNAAKGINTDTGTVRCVVTGNTLEFNGTNGVDFDGTKSTIVGNQIGNNGGNGTVLGGVDNVVTGNICEANGTHGIAMLSGATECLVQGNRCLGNTSNGIDIAAGANDNMVIDNLAEGNTADSIVDAGTDNQLARVQRDIEADQFQLPNNADWAVNALAPVVADSTNAALSVALFDDAAEEGVGFEQQIPYVVTKLKFTFWSRCESAPTAPNLDVGPHLYTREIIGDSTDVGGWSGATHLATITFPAGADGALFLKTTDTFNLSTLGLTAGRKYQFELTRDTTGNNVVGDWVLLGITLEYS